MSMSINAYRRKLREQEQPTSPSKRWQTTAQSAMQEIADQITHSDHESMVQSLRDRKISNTKTSISFGNEKVLYESDAMENQRNILLANDAAERSHRAKVIKQMKTELTTTNFRLGDEHPEYESVCHEAMRASESFPKGKVGLNTDLKEAVKKSSLHFGNAAVDYKSAAHEAMEYKGNNNDFMALKDDISKMKVSLRKHNFTFGDEKVNYTSDYTSGYGSLPHEAYLYKHKNKESIRAIIEDSRACHFSLGKDQALYSTNTQEALKGVLSFPAADVQKQIDNAKSMKLALQKTSIVIGDDKEFM